MKFILSVTFLIITCFFAQAQSNTFPSSGNVGIGTTSPQNKLELHGPFTLHHPGTHVLLYYMTYSNGAALLMNDAGGATKIDLRANGVTYFNGGNVGIGTTAPDAKLTVKGVIHAEEVKVDLAVPGPDYVFDDSYPLRSLEDTKAYINQHKHLPGIPSSNEMQQNGVNLLEMNMKLLEKVEELTLHLIEMKRENEEQQKQLNKLLEKSEL